MHEGMTRTRTKKRRNRKKTEPCFGGAIMKTKGKRSVKKDKDLLGRNCHENVGKKVQGRM